MALLPINKRQFRWNISASSSKRLFRCDQCGKVFPRDLHKRVGNHDFCSRACKHEFQKGKVRVCSPPPDKTST